MDAPTQRPTSRLILAGPDDRVLLFPLALPDPWAPKQAWHLPGGAIEPGETPAQAAAREALEETGHVLDLAELGGPVATNEGPWSIKGRPYYSVHLYFFARVPSSAHAPAVPDDHRHERFSEGRWWSAEELAEARDHVFPPGLPDLLPGLLAGDRPADLVRIPWTHS